MRVLVGASVLSAAGSLPLQILPFLVLTLVSEGRLDIAYAGWVGSAFLIGMLSSALLLPAMGVSVLNRWRALLALSAIVVAIAASIGARFLPVFLALWYVVGLACGGLQFLGATTAAAAANKPQAFALRLAVALLVASAVIVLVSQMGGQKSYTLLAYCLMGSFTLAACVGLGLYRQTRTVQPIASNTNPLAAVRSWSGLIVVFAFFVGQPGFWAYAMQSASQRGLDLVGAAFVIAASKTTSAVVLLYSSKKASPSTATRTLLGLGCTVAAGILVMTYSWLVMAFLIGFLIWELALNVLSARLQGVVVAASPGHAGAWITGAILLGAATGPMIHGAAIAGGVEFAFITYAAFSGLFPFFWVLTRAKTAVKV